MQASNKANLISRLGLLGPLIQAPLGGGPTTPELVTSVSNAGALGSLAGAYLSPDELGNNIREVKKLTDRSFAVNLFSPCPDPSLTEDQVREAIDATKSYRRKLGLPDPSLRPPFSQNFEDQFSVILKERPAVFSFTFGIPDRKYLEQCRELGILTCGTATTLDEALFLEEAGVDAVVAQGAEAGAQRGTFSAGTEDLFMGLMALVSTLVGKLQIPVIAAGGIMNGRGIAAALALGAQAAQLGTAFLLCDESGTSEPYRNALRDPSRRRTRPTRAFSGRWARGLENQFIVEMASKENAILPFPAQNAFTQDIRRKAAQLRQPEYLSLWAGQSIGLIRAMKAAMLVETLFEETREAVENLGGYLGQFAFMAREKNSGSDSV